jgi:hypothetical protein
MNTTPFSTLHVISTTASDRPRSDQDRPQVDATRRARAAGERALVLGGGGSTGNAWLIGVIAGLFDAGLDVTEADLTIGTSAGSTAAAQMAGATPSELLAAILAAAPQQRTGPVGSDRGRVPIRPVADHMERTSRIIAAAEGAADMRRRMGAAALDMDAASDGSWQTQRQPVHRRRLPIQRRECRSGSRIRAGAGAVTIRRPDTDAAGLGHAPRNTGRRTTRTWQQSRNDLPGQQLRAHVRRQRDGSVATSARCSGWLRPR